MPPKTQLQKQPTSTEKPKMRFRLLRGTHRVGAKRDPQNTSKILEPGINFKPGDIITTHVDLAAKFPSFPPKFLRIDEAAQAETEMSSVYAQMSLQELKALCEEQELDTANMTTKQEFINLLLQAV